MMLLAQQQICKATVLAAVKSDEMPMTVCSFQAFYYYVQVFDECHHTQKNNPFNKIALKYTQLTAEQQTHLQVC